MIVYYGMSKNDFTKGRILGPLVRFVIPIFGAMLLQAMYGAVDLIVVGKFGVSADISAVATGAQIMNSLTHIIVGLAMGTTVLIGQYIGANKKDKAGDIIASSIVLFAVVAVVLSVLVPVSAGLLADILNAPKEAYDKTVSYISICGSGLLFIVSYNLLGSIFRGIGDSKTPLISVCIAAVLNVFGDVFLVKNLGMGAGGAAIATIASQGISVIICFFIIRKRGLPFHFGKDSFKNGIKEIIKEIVKLGIPIAFQSFMVNISFLVIVSIVNSLGLTASAGIGTSEKVTSFIMLVPSAFSQGLSAFVAQNIGAENESRAAKALLYGMLVSFAVDVLIFFFTFFKGVDLCMIFTNDIEIAKAGSQYLKAYSIDVLLTTWMFCMVGYFNGCGETKFTMFQGILAAFLIRIPVSIVMNRITDGNLFCIGLATPSATFVQIIMCVVFYFRRRKQFPITDGSK